MLLASVDSVVQFITVFLIFVFVLALTYLTTRFVGGYQKGKQAGSNIHVIETSKVAANKFLQIIQVGDRYFLISICKDQMSLISELQEEDISLPENKELAPLHFKDILEKAKNLTQKK